MKVVGKHLIIDAYGVNPKLLASRKKVFGILNALPLKVGMRKLTEPKVVICDDVAKKKDWGVSGFVMIYESHISCHTWPELGYLSMDVYSCRNFDHKKVLDILKEYWQWRNVKTKVIRRIRSSGESDRHR